MSQSAERVATNVRLELDPHPTARHGFARPDGVTEDEYYDEMPMWEDGELYEPTEQPRHRKDD